MLMGHALKCFNLRTGIVARKVEITMRYPSIVFAFILVLIFTIVFNLFLFLFSSPKGQLPTSKSP